MATLWVRNMKLSPKSVPLIVGVVTLAFATVSLGVLLSDVTRDDLLALHYAFDGSKFANAEVGHFFEVSSDEVHGPLCSDKYNRPQTQEKHVIVVNKLGATLPILTNGLGEVFSFGDHDVTHSLAWQVTDEAIASDALWGFARNILNTRGDCGQTIDDRTRNRKVRICPVHRVWKDENGQTVALFFDPYAINGCRQDDIDGDCSHCPRFISGQFWTAVKLKLDLIEVGDA